MPNKVGLRTFPGADDEWDDEHDNDDHKKSNDSTQDIDDHVHAVLIDVTLSSCYQQRQLENIKLHISTYAKHIVFLSMRVQRAARAYLK